MLIQLAGCHQHLPSHFASQFTSSDSLPPRFSMQAVGLQLRKSSFDSLRAVLICFRVITQYFSQLSSPLPSIHLSRDSLTNSSLQLRVIHWQQVILERNVLVSRKTLLYYDLMCLFNVVWVVWSVNVYVFLFSLFFVFSFSSFVGLSKLRFVVLCHYFYNIVLLNTSQVKMFAMS